MIKMIEQLKIHEGFRGDYYQCTANKKTIGYGRNVDNNPFSELESNYLGRTEFDIIPMTEIEAEFLLSNDVTDVTESLDKKGVDLSELNEPRKAVCINMAFNLGVNGFCKFKNMIAAINDCYYEKAADEMLNSRWAKQVPNRALELSLQMSTGVW